MLISGAQQSRLPPRAENRLRGRLSDLESLKSGKDRTKTRVRLLFALERTKTATDFHRELSRRPVKLMTALTRSGRILFATQFAIANLLQPNDARYCGL